MAGSSPSTRSLPHVPEVAGALEYRSDSGRQMTIAVLHEFVPNVGDAWTYTLDELARYFERVQSQTPEPACRAVTAVHATLSGTMRQSISLLHDWIAASRLCRSSLIARAAAAGAGHDRRLSVLGRAAGPPHWPSCTWRWRKPTAALHSRPSRSRGCISAAYTNRCGARPARRWSLLRSQIAIDLDDEAQQQAEQRAGSRARDRLREFGELLHDRIDARRIRCHGDLHLGQVLFTGKDFVIIDFEGEPERPVSERRIKASPLRDVAGMLRSFHYAAHAALRGQTPTLFVQHASIPIEQWAAFWSTWVSAAFLQSLSGASRSRATSCRPIRRSSTRCLAAYLLEKALYELRYELNNRPDWVNIPLEGILQLCSELKRQSEPSMDAAHHAS